MIRVGDHWLADFASCNYLGFDLDPEIIAAIPAYLEQWGTHPSWSRLLGSPVLYEQIEERLTELLGSEDSLVLPTITHIHTSVIPVLAASGHDLPRRARPQDDLRRLPGRPLARRRRAALPLRRPRPPRRAARRRARPRAAGVHGRRQQHDRQRPRPAGVRGGRAPPRRAAVRRRRTRLRRDRRARRRRAVPVRRARQQHRAPLRRELRRHRPGRRLLQGVLVAARVHRLPDGGQEPAEGGRAALPLLGALAGRLARHRARRLRRQRDAAATSCAGLLHRHSAAASSTALAELDVHTPNRSGLPIIEVPLRDHDASTRSGGCCSTRGVYVTLAAYPLVPKAEVGFRVQLTAANTEPSSRPPDRGASGELAGAGELRSASRGTGATPRAMRVVATHSARSRHAAVRSALAGLPRVRRVRHVPVPARTAAQGQRGAAQHARHHELDRGDRRHPPQPARATRCRGGCSRSGSSCTGWATSTRTATRSCILHTKSRSRRSATRST